MNPKMKIDHTWTVTVERPGDEWADLQKRCTTQVFRPAWVKVEIRKDYCGAMQLRSVEANGRRVLKYGLSDIRLTETWFASRGAVSERLPEWLSAVVAEVFEHIKAQEG